MTNLEKLKKMTELSDKLLNQVLPQAANIVLDVGVAYELGLLIEDVKRSSIGIVQPASNVSLKEYSNHVHYYCDDETIKKFCDLVDDLIEKDKKTSQDLL